MLSKVLCAFIVLTLALLTPAFAMDRSELRAAWEQLSLQYDDASPYQELPDLSAFSAGALTPQAQQDALGCLNFIRRVAGLEPVDLSALYTLRAQNGALLLAINDRLEHDAPRPDGMDADLYASAHMGTSLGNIARFNWMKPDILIDGVRYFARDDGDTNLAVLGHRRWLLNPCMSQTGFGLANSASGMSYVTMYAVDEGNANAEWDYVAWPAADAFPVELMRSSLPWSISLNDAKYDLSSSQIKIYLMEENSGASFSFDPASGMGDGFCALSAEACGSGVCAIFRPNLDGADIDEYVQNQRWSVRIDGLIGWDGAEHPIEYVSEMTSLYPQEVANIELSQIDAALEIGDTLILRAGVIPAYADDLSVTWGSSDPAVATVNARGEVTAAGSGSCAVTAMSANGKKDVCTITVQ